MRKYLFFVLIILFLTVPFIVSAAEWKWGDPLVICGREGQADCTLCDIFKLAQVIVRFITTGLFIIAPIFIVLGGIKILIGGAKPDEVQAGKKMITNAIVGIVIALVAWVVINMIFNALAKPPGQGGIPWPWNKIDCEGGGVTEGGGEVEQGQYCVCETPVYDLNPHTDNTASVIGTNAKITIFNNKDECLENCTSSYSGNYCVSSLKYDQAKMYCSDKSGLQSKPACTLNLTSTSCPISSTCYNSEQECLDASKTTFKTKCYLDGQALCTCYKGSQKNLCGNASDKYMVWRIKHETPTSSGDSLFNCGGTASTYCRLNCQYEKCVSESADRCKSLNPPLNQKAACFGGKFQCQQGVIGQQGDASTELINFLDCMANKLSTGAKEISSISDNSGGRCFTQWNKKCSNKEDSCSGTCCGHSQYSLHYGGKAGSGDCRIRSYAVDFASTTYKNEIEKSSKECAKSLWLGAGLDKVYVEPEGKHVHVQLDGIAKYHRCK
jgi:hypothetical protein